MSRMLVRLSRDSLCSLLRARMEARESGDGYISPEHILLGILKFGVAAQVLADLGVDTSRTRQRLEREITAIPGALKFNPLPFTSQAENVLKAAFSEAEKLGHDSIGTGHLLLGILKEGKNVAAAELKGLGVDLECARARVLAAPREVLES